MSRRHRLPLLDADLEKRAQTFHDANGDVYAKLRELAFEARRAGAGRIGIAALFERLRWLSQVETAGDKYALNNSYRSFYARLLMKNEPQLAGMFVTRDAAFDPEYRERPERGASL